VAKGPLLQSFTRALDDDLNVAAAWGAIFEWVRETNRKLASKALNAADAAALLADWKEVEMVLGMSKPHRDRAVPPEMMDLLQARQEARWNKDFSRADAIREELKSRGWMIDDTSEGPKLKPI
jgi:cysteinyl-tRNA synthetase